MGLSWQQQLCQISFCRGALPGSQGGSPWTSSTASSWWVSGSPSPGASSWWAPCNLAQAKHATCTCALVPVHQKCFFSQCLKTVKEKFRFPGCEKERWGQGALQIEGRLGKFRERGKLGQRTMLCVPLNYFYDITLQFWKFNLLAKFCMSCCDYDLSFDAFDLKLR